MNKILRVFSIALCSTFFVASSWAEIVVIAHPTVDVSVTKSDISRLYLGKSKSLPGGIKAKPVSLPAGNKTRDEFNTKVLEQSDSQFKSHWSRLFFSGQAKHPKEVSSETDVIELVSSNPGSIGYISKENVTDKVKVLATY